MSLFLAVLTDRNSKSLKLDVRTDEIDPSCISIISEQRPNSAHLNFSYFHACSVCKLSSTSPPPPFMFPLPPPVCAPRAGRA